MSFANSMSAVRNIRQVRDWIMAMQAAEAAQRHFRKDVQCTHTLQLQLSLQLCHQVMWAIRVYQYMWFIWTYSTVCGMWYAACVSKTWELFESVVLELAQSHHNLELKRQDGWAEIGLQSMPTACKGISRSTFLFWPTTRFHITSHSLR